MDSIKAHIIASRVADDLLEIMGHLGAAKIQRVDSDDNIIAGHIDDALEIARTAYRQLTHTKVQS